MDKQMRRERRGLLQLKIVGDIVGLVHGWATSKPVIPVTTMEPVAAYMRPIFDGHVSRSCSPKRSLRCVQKMR